MKKMLTAGLISAALSTGTFAHSSDAKPGKSMTREIPIEAAFQKIAMHRGALYLVMQHTHAPDLLSPVPTKRRHAVHARQKAEHLPKLSS